MDFQWQYDGKILRLCFEEDGEGLICSGIGQLVPAKSRMGVLSCSGCAADSSEPRKLAKLSPYGEPAPDKNLGKDSGCCSRRSCCYRQVRRCRASRRRPSLSTSKWSTCSPLCETSRDRSS